MKMQKQRGAALLIGLIVLLVLTIIGVHASRSSTMGLIAATNSQEAALALAAAEDSVAAGERRVLDEFGGDEPGDLDDDGSDGFYMDGTLDHNTFNWDQVNGVEREFDAGGVLIAEYVVEYITDGVAQGESLSVTAVGATNQIYRISGRGLGARGSARLVQTIFAAQN